LSESVFSESMLRETYKGLSRLSFFISELHIDTETT
jgi:hypothetical protein